MSITTPVTIAQHRLALPDPHDCTDSADALALLEAVFDALVRRGPDGRFQPAVAKRWSLSEDARTWTFSLREGLVFHDGSALDVEAVCFSIERMMRPEIGATLGAPAVWRQYLEGAKVTAVDSRTVTIALAAPLADLLDILAYGYILPPRSADEPGFADRPIGSGAYRIDEIEPGASIRMSANRHWRGGALANERLTWRRDADPVGRAEAVGRGDVQVATRLSPSAGRNLQSTRPVTAATHIDPTAIIFLLNAAAGPFTDPRVRRAINLATDRQALVDEVLGGAGSPLTAVVSPVHPGAGPVRAGEDLDRDTARRLLSEAGHGDGLKVVTDRPTTLPDEAAALTEALAGQLSSVGIELDIRVTRDRTAYAEMIRDKAGHDMSLFDSSPMSTFRVLHEKIDSRVEGAWWQGYRNVQVERLLDEARTLPAVDERERVLGKAVDTLRADPPWLTLYNHVRSTVLSGRHPGWRPRPDGILDVTCLPRLA